MVPVDPVPAPHSFLQGASRRALAVLTDRREPGGLIDQWRDTTARRVGRSEALPLADPPGVALSARRAGDALRVTLSAPEVATIRWERPGADDADPRGLVVEEGGRALTWRPELADEQLCVAVRTAGGVTIAALRACDVA